MKYFLTLGIVAMIVFTGGGCATEPELIEGESTSIETLNMNEEVTEALAFPGALSEEKISGKQIRITTEKGDIVFELFADTAPLAVSNMVYLTQNEFYNGLTFHRRVAGFVIQGGDPNGTGTGGPGWSFEDELK